MTDAIFERDGERYVPTILARGPWDRRALHGGAVAALLARCLEPAAPEHAVARLTVDFLRPAPLAPMTVETRMVRTGRQVQSCEALLSADGVEIAWGQVLFIRRKPLATTVPGALTVRAGETSPPDWSRYQPVADPPGVDYEAFHNTGMEVRFVRGALTEPGPATAWFRFAKPLLPEEALSPLVRAAAAGDYGNGVASVLAWDDHSFINPELSVYLHREAEGEWICLDSVTRPGPEGIALAESQMFDRAGPIGRALQSVLMEQAPGPGA